MAMNFDHAIGSRKLFLRGSIWERARRWLRARTFGLL